MRALYAVIALIALMGAVTAVINGNWTAAGLLSASFFFMAGWFVAANAAHAARHEEDER